MDTPSQEESSAPSAEWLELRAARIRVAEWVAAERQEHADVKYDTGLRQEGITRLRKEGFADGSYWDVFVMNYLGRVKLFDPRTIKGKQQLGKLIVTLTALYEAAVVLDHDLPTPGEPS